MTVLPAHREASGPRRSPWGTFFSVLFALLFLASLAFNFVFLLLLIISFVAVGNLEGETPLRVHHYSGKKTASDKIAVIRIDGVLLEGFTTYAERQIDQAAKDDSVKAVVVRINSPGGSITASDDLFKRLKELRFGNKEKNYHAKPLVVSMGSLAASGGYYIAMPAQHVVAERSTITGSIGVYASFLNIADLAEKYGFRMETIKAGAVKDSGSMFHHMTPQERKIWQDMVDHAYRQFIAVVEEGRPKLKGKLSTEIIIKEEIPLDDKGNVASDKKGTKSIELTRVRADGGIFTADKAKELGLIDQIGYLDDAIAEARKIAGLGEDYKVIRYEKPVNLGSILGINGEQEESKLDFTNLSKGASPRLWYLAPQSELAGLLAASKSE
jgi:protease-4